MSQTPARMSLRHFAVAAGGLLGEVGLHALQPVRRLLGAMRAITAAENSETL